jgi:hypothetical protein
MMKNKSYNQKIVIDPTRNRMSLKRRTKNRGLDIKQGRYTKNMLTSQTLKNEMGATIHHK